jgi:CRP-like cAMP-binding protein
VVAKKKKGETFGEIALTGKDQRTATIRAVTIVEVLRLHKVDYDHFVRDIQLAERRDHYHLLRECRLFDRYCAVMFICTD